MYIYTCIYIYIYTYVQCIHNISKPCSRFAIPRPNRGHEDGRLRHREGRETHERGPETNMGVSTLFV